MCVCVCVCECPCVCMFVCAHAGPCNHEHAPHEQSLQAEMLNEAVLCEHREPKQVSLQTHSLLETCVP